jgi:hypothetical protein
MAGLRKKVVYGRGNRDESALRGVFARGTVTYKAFDRRGPESLAMWRGRPAGSRLRRTA